MRQCAFVLCLLTISASLCSGVVSFIPGQRTIISIGKHLVLFVVYRYAVQLNCLIQNTGTLYPYSRRTFFLVSRMRSSSTGSICPPEKSLQYVFLYHGAEPFQKIYKANLSSSAFGQICWRDIQCNPNFLILKTFSDLHKHYFVYRYGFRKPVFRLTTFLQKKCWQTHHKRCKIEPNFAKMLICLN
jgi:hypothetical protein